MTSDMDTVQCRHSGDQLDLTMLRPQRPRDGWAQGGIVLDQQYPHDADVFPLMACVPPAILAQLKPNLNRAVQRASGRIT